MAGYRGCLERLAERKVAMNTMSERVATETPKAEADLPPARHAAPPSAWSHENRRGASPAVASLPFIGRGTDGA